ncbi:hypothetical protein Q9295_17760 [Xinfangfangia sp. CPCC 101601]|uniref:DNA-binding protein n=1 Tax=Pseudogemmobacter lacusdianii TaxID=3069608 RepID=A0ABU0W426_9RHOB|nr:hypothetical protein [Xinfangfangia sp. CPCC 101601]MDQ2068215.1 hypothetical protein [Xinfangfangia sp. CPCC 101601]
MKLSLNQAARICGRAKSTLLDAIKSGRLSAIKTTTGRYEIDPSELHRVFPFSAPEHPEPAFDRTPEPIPTTQENHSKTRELELEVQLLREMLEKAETNADHWRKMAERQQALLEDKRPKGFFKWLIGQ